MREIRNPRADGFCGFSAAAHSLMGESSYPVVKQKMLQALEKYHGRYISELQITANELEAAKQTITCGIDRPVVDVQKADKRALETCDFTEQGESKEALAKMMLNDKTIDGHCRAVCARTTYWFQDFDCGQILADAFAVPVCIYPSEDNQKPFTFLPLDLPKNRKIKPNPIHLQHTPFHWISLRFTATHSDLPAIFYTEHWNKKANFAMYRDY